LLVTPFPQQQFNATEDRRSLAPSTGVTCFDCHVNGHTNGATHLVGDIRPQEFRHRLDTPSLRGPEDDEALGAAVAAAGNVVLGAAVAEDLQVVPGLDMVYERATLNQPIEVIRRGAAAVAPVNMLREQGGQIRKAVVRMPMADEWLLGFDAQLHALVARAGLSVAPLPTTPTVLINFRGGPNTYPWISYYQVIRGEVPSTVFADKIVLIGPTSEILHDQFPTAFARGGDMPGVEVHANALETLIRGNPIREVPPGVSTALAMATALLGAVLVVRLHAFRALVAALGVWAVLVVAAYAGGGPVAGGGGPIGGGTESGCGWRLAGERTAGGRSGIRGPAPCSGAGTSGTWEASRRCL